MPEPEISKPKCPECDTELIAIDGKLPDECAKCHFVLSGFPEFKRWMDAYEKGKKPAGPEPAAKRGSIFGGLTRGK